MRRLIWSRRPSSRCWSFCLLASPSPSPSRGALSFLLVVAEGSGNQVDETNGKTRRTPDPNSQHPRRRLRRLLPTRRGPAPIPPAEPQVPAVRSPSPTLRSLFRESKGEHIDYEGYSVLPMAIRQDPIVAIRKHDDGDAEKILRIANVNDKYQICTYPADPTQEIDLKNHK